jgi:hypothetical protein
MRSRPSLTLIVGLSLWACGDHADPADPVAPTAGTVAITTSTTGDDPDPDGFHLRIDRSDSLALLPSDTAELELSPGRHTLQLVGVAAHCSVTPETSVEVDITSGSTTPLAFQVSCPLTGARITVTTTGQDLAPGGYQVMADGGYRGAIASNGTILTKLDPGARTIALTGLTPDCAIDGPASRTVMIVNQEVVSIDFTVICTTIPRTIQLTIYSLIDGGTTLYGYIPLHVTVDGQTRDIQVPEMVTSTLFFGGVTRGEVDVQARSSSYPASRANCLVQGSGGFIKRVSTVEDDTTEVKLHVSAGHCVFP